jgi:hypothetical protein
MPDEKVAAHRLSSLFEGLFMDSATACDLIQAGVDPEQWQEAVRERLRQIADNDVTHFIGTESWRLFIMILTATA